MKIPFIFIFFMLASLEDLMDYFLMTANYTLLAAALLFLNASSLNSPAYQSSIQVAPNRLERLDQSPGGDPGDAVPPWWAKNLDQKTIAELNDLDAALRKYMKDHDLTTPLPRTLTLQDLVKGKYVKEIPPAPPGKAFAIAYVRGYVVLVDSK